MNWIKYYSLIVVILLNNSLVTAQQQSTIDRVKLNDKFYKIICTNGTRTTNVLVCCGDDGILLVDGGYLETANQLISTVESFEYGDVKVLINTHFHNDHTGINKLINNESVDIIAHENTRKRLEGAFGILSNIFANSLPNLTFTDTMKFSFNKENIELIYFPGHSDADVIVHFKDSKIVFMGDLLVTNGFPSVEIESGGDIEMYLKSFKKILDSFNEDYKFIAGHGNDYNFNEMKQYYQMAVETTEIIRNGLKEGKDINAMRKEGLLKKWEYRVTNGATADYWIGAVAESLLHKKSKPSIIEPILLVLRNGNAEKAIMKYKELKKDYFFKYAFEESALNQLGYYLLRNDRIPEAIDIFRLNVKEYPDSYNVYDSLGEAYMKSGDTKNAIANYEISLILNPANINANVMLARLRGH